MQQSGLLYRVYNLIYLPAPLGALLPSLLISMYK